MIDVPDDTSGFVDGSDGFGGINGRAGEKAVVSGRKMLLSGLWPVKFEDWLVITHEVHDEAFKITGLVASDCKRKSNERGLSGKPHADDGRNLRLAGSAVGCGIELDGACCVVGKCIDLPLATLSDLLSNGGCLAVNKQLRDGHRNAATKSVLSSSVRAFTA